MKDFLDEPACSARRTQRGVYAAYTFGAPPHAVTVLMLDVRFHRTEPGAEGDMLGEEQWSWLERELRQSTSQLHLIVTGLQVLPRHFGEVSHSVH